jgi:hypothetical protein
MIMQNAKIALWLGLSIAFLAIIMAPLSNAHATATSPVVTSLYTAKADGTISSTFAMGEEVRIIASSTGSWNIIVSDPSGTAQFTDAFTLQYNKTISGITDTPGNWTVKLYPVLKGSPTPQTEPSPQTTSSTSITYTVDPPATVVPEAPLGTISIFLALFAAFGIALFRKKNKTKLLP